jgi:hypothetical protein
MRTSIIKISPLEVTVKQLDGFAACKTRYDKDPQSLHPCIGTQAATEAQVRRRVAVVFMKYWFETIRKQTVITPASLMDSH